jgi:hypothetical protein
LVDGGPPLSLAEAERRRLAPCQHRDQLLKKLAEEKFLDNINMYNPAPSQLRCGSGYDVCFHGPASSACEAEAVATSANGCARIRQSRRVSMSVVAGQSPPGTHLLHHLRDIIMQTGILN